MRAGLSAAILGWGLILAPPLHAESGPAPVESGARRLREAIARRYDCDLRAVVVLEIRGRDGATRTRTLEMLSKQRGGRTHAIGRVLEPEHLRGMALLTIEAAGRSDDSFVFLPSLGRTRRVSGGRRGESFLGSDLTFADLDRHRPDDYRVLRESPAEHAAEPAMRVVAETLVDAAFPRVDFVVADADLALLAIEYRDASGSLVRSVEAARQGMHEAGARRIPTRLVATNLRRGTRTRVRFERLEIDPAIDDHLFSFATLESGRPLHPARR